MTRTQATHTILVLSALLLGAGACTVPSGDLGEYTGPDDETNGKADTTSATTTATTTTTSTSTTDPGETEPTTTANDPSGVPSTDEQLCIDYCSNLIARDAGCEGANHSCYERCINGITLAKDCRAETRAARRCEAEAAAFDEEWCETPECASVYAAFDLCKGFCSHHGAEQATGTADDYCEFGSNVHDGHEYEMQCMIGDAPLCSCSIDGAQVGECQLAFGLESWNCNITVFDGCCNEFFVPVLQPAVIDEPSEPVPGGTASPGDPCSLVGLFLACDLSGVAGRTFCDEIDGSMKFGPCITFAELDCEFVSDGCTGSCQLLEGVPTWVPEECMESTSG